MFTALDCTDTMDRKIRNYWTIFSGTDHCIRFNNFGRNLTSHKSTKSQEIKLNHKNLGIGTNWIIWRNQWK